MPSLTRLIAAAKRLYHLPGQLNTLQEAVGRIESRLHRGLSGEPRDFEFKVYSQWGEDGILDFLVSNIPIPRRTFVEFGVETYTEANTLFLLKHRHWNGLVIDGSAENIEAIRRGPVFWRHDLMAECSFITRDNINQILQRHSISGDIGLLSVDIDGNDYWVWEAITDISPRIVVCEYNSLFGPSAAVSVPYQADFQRHRAHPSNMYYGASITALEHLAKSKGYCMVAGNSAGNNVFFVREDCRGALRIQTAAEAYVRAGFRESRSVENGEVQHLSFEERRAAIGALPVIDVVNGRRDRLGAFA